MKPTNSTLRTDLRLFVLVSLILTLIGFVFIYSSSSAYAIAKCGGQGSYYVRRQFFGFLLGFIALCAVRWLPLNFLKRMSPLLFLGSLGLTALTMIPGFAVHIHGSSRWLSLAGIAFQPSEFLKVTLILYLAYLLEKREHQTMVLLRAYLPLFVIIGITSAILLKQPDFGLTVTLALTSCALIFISQRQLKPLWYSLVATLPLIGYLIIFKPYRLHRILTFLNPWADPQGAGFQIIQSLIAIGSGGLWGVGITHSKQKFFYLPMQHTDFIFSIIAEETGFIGASLLVTLFATLVYVGLRIARSMQQSFSLFACTGYVVLIGLQAFINLAVATGIAPTKGIGLPFVSYGNTALIANMMMIGIIMNCVASDHENQRV
jgi:cell division protein FtsW